MILFTSSKGQNFDPCPLVTTSTTPIFQQKAAILNEHLKAYSSADLKQLMGISDALCSETLQKIEQFSTTTGKPALFTFSGEAFKSLQPDTLPPKALAFAESNFRILSGLYGVLRPFDAISAYRLEMGYKLANEAGSTLYPFWKEAVTQYLNTALEENKSEQLINLASVEYSKVVDKKVLTFPIVDIHFKEEDGGRLKSIAVYAKRARGMMARYLLTHQITELSEIMQFDQGGYRYQAELSKKHLLVFTRPKP